MLLLRLMMLPFDSDARGKFASIKRSLIEFAAAEKVYSSAVVQSGLSLVFTIAITTIFVNALLVGLVLAFLLASVSVFPTLFSIGSSGEALGWACLALLFAGIVGVVYIVKQAVTLKRIILEYFEHWRNSDASDPNQLH